MCLRLHNTDRSPALRRSAASKASRSLILYFTQGASGRLIVEYGPAHTVWFQPRQLDFLCPQHAGFRLDSSRLQSWSPELAFSHGQGPFLILETLVNIKFYNPTEEGQDSSCVAPGHSYATWQGLCLRGGAPSVAHQNLSAG